MAAEQGHRSEQPTPRRKDKAREEGQVPSSREFTSSVQFAAAILMLWVWGGDVVEGLNRTAVGLFREAFRGSVRVERLREVVVALGTDTLSFLAVYGAVLLTLGAVVHMTQTGFALTLKRLSPDLNRLNPKQRLSDLPGENLSQLLKAFVMLPAVGAVFWYIVRDELDSFLRLPSMSFELGAALLTGSMTELLAKAAVLLIALGVFDLFRQRRKIHKKLMMTKQEIKQEHKDLEGNPQIKAKLRRLQREMMRRRMMSDVPKATVVVTNPSHYAVALRYAPESMPAPVVVAMGLDHLALRIRRVAEEHKIPIVVNPPLAQALYKSAEIGGEIPIELYRAVAEILAHIFRLSQGMSTPRG
jgi:flagellar biosynthetic protein FlhB